MTEYQIKKIIVVERMRAIEILHKYALKTKTTEELDLIEAAQKEILNANI